MISAGVLRNNSNVNLSDTEKEAKEKNSKVLPRGSIGTAMEKPLNNKHKNSGASAIWEKIF